MSTTEEIRFTASLLNESNAEYTFLHCNSTYPAPFEDINLSWIKELKKIHSNVGYSGHERGISVTLAAVAMGISIIERHFTLDRNMEGPDHAASLEFDEFSRLVKGVREVESALGSVSDERPLSQGEMINRENLAKSLISSRPLKAGITITSEDIIIKSPGQGLSPQHYNNLIGKILARDMDTEDFFYQSDISSEKFLPRKYKFSRKWGIPVRFHDFARFFQMSKPDLVEFHLSYQDMLLDPAEFLEEGYECGFVVHAPELFENSELSFYPFFNDNTDLSNSAINKRGKNKRLYKVSGNTGSLSSYVVKLSGKNFLYLQDLSYHFAYKKIDVNSSDLSEESGYISNFEYLFNIGRNTSIIPSYEIVKTNNVNGGRGVDSLHQIASIYFNYNSWSFSTSHFQKNITETGNKISDKYIEYNIGYRISDNMKVGVSRIGAKENNIEYRSFYTMFSYFKEF